MLDTFDGGGLRGHLNLDGVLQQVTGQLADFTRHGGREEQVLAAGGQAADNLTDRLDEAEVQHLVGLVEHENFGRGQVDVLLLYVVQQTARCGHQNVQTLLQGAFLCAVFHAAEYNSDAEAKVLAIGFEAVGDLGGQFARRRQDQGARGARKRLDAVFCQAMQDRQGEGGGLTGAGLGNTQQVGTLHDMGDGLGLDRGRLLIARRFQGGEQAGVQAKGFKGVGGIGHVCLSRMTTDASSRQAVQRASSARNPRAGNGRRPACPDDV